jgi:adenosylhomocysteine/aminodeoxyfutalosine nucleosidase
MTIGIIGAMVEEIQPLLDIFGKYKKNNYADNIYYETSYGNIDIVIAHSKIGKVFSTLTTTIMIERFKCEKILFSGVAGAIRSDLNIGDLIIANKLCQHDLDITVFGHPHGFVPGGSVYISTDKKLNQIASLVADDLGIDLKDGIIASGDQFISSEDKKEFIKKEFKADALEMEGASVALVCDNLKVPCLVLRSISDSADGNANIDFDDFLIKSSQNSAEFMFKIIKKLEK